MYKILKLAPETQRIVIPRRCYKEISTKCFQDNSKKKKKISDYIWKIK